MCINGSVGCGFSFSFSCHVTAGVANLKNTEIGKKKTPLKYTFKQMKQYQLSNSKFHN